MAELIAAVREGDEVEAKRLLDHGADVHPRDQNQRTPLHCATNEAMVKLLLNQGADVNASRWHAEYIFNAGSPNNSGTTGGI